MKVIRGYPVRFVGTGFIVLVLLSLPLFCLRWYCTFVLAVRMSDETRHVYIRPSGVMPEEIERDPNVVAPSSVFGWMRSGRPLVLGMVDYFVGGVPERNRSNILYYDEKKGDFLYFDEKRGLLVHRYSYEMRTIPDNKLVRQRVKLYAGPEGMSETPDKNLGRFIEPVLERTYNRSKAFVYDRIQRRFFAVDFDERRVRRGPELGKDDLHEPIQIGELLKNWQLLSLDWSYPTALKLSKEEEDALRKEYALYKEHLEKPGIQPGYGPPGYGAESYTGYWDLKKTFHEREKVPRAMEYSPRGGDEYILVLDKSGRIELLDRKTLEFAGTAGYLPAPETLFASKGTVSAKDLLGYIVRPMAFRPDGKYRGMFVVGLSREGTSMRLVVFDENGKTVRFKDSETEPSETGALSRPVSRRSISSSKAVFFERPWGPALMIGKYVLENLQAPVLSIGSYFTASSFEAGSGHRALFILPNSFIGMLGRQVDEDYIWKFSRGVLLILPSIILSVFLAARIFKDAAKVGFSEDARLCWMIGTLCFGLTAYITYRLTKPKDVLVTCANCGRLRRPDMNICHHCRSKWVVGELTPPNWRVVDEQD
jgi:hypothetical protein